MPLICSALFKFLLELYILYPLTHLYYQLSPLDIERSEQSEVFAKIL